MTVSLKPFLLPPSHLYLTSPTNLAMPFSISQMAYLSLDHVPLYPHICLYLSPLHLCCSL